MSIQQIKAVDCALEVLTTRFFTESNELKRNDAIDALVDLREKRNESEKFQSIMRNKHLYEYIGRHNERKKQMEQEERDARFAIQCQPRGPDPRRELNFIDAKELDLLKPGGLNHL